jgi:putative ABC transport system permease protein
MWAVLATVAAGLRGRRLQAGIIGVVALLAAASGTIALSILVETREPFQRAFAAANGAHLVVELDPRVTDAQLATAATAPGVTGTAGPFDVVRSAVARVGGGPLEPGQVSSRVDPAATIDRITVVAGGWWREPGEAVLDEATADVLGVTVGGSVSFYDTGGTGASKGGGGQVPVRPGQKAELRPILTATVVGVARSVSTPGTIAWMSPASVAALAGDDGPERQVLYRVTPSASEADLGSAAAAISSRVPDGMVRSTLSYLETMAVVDRCARLYVPVLVAFSALALLAAAFAIANVVGGIVLTRYRDIGIQKALGFTPRRSRPACSPRCCCPPWRARWPASPSGSRRAGPPSRPPRARSGCRDRSRRRPRWSRWCSGRRSACPRRRLAPAAQAGRLRTVEAIAQGRGTTGSAPARRLRHLAGRLPLGLPERLGVSAGLARPLPAAMTLGAITVGVAAATFALGLDASLVRVVAIADRAEAAPVRVALIEPSADAAEATARVIAARPGTGRMTGVGRRRPTCRRSGRSRSSATTATRHGSATSHPRPLAGRTRRGRPDGGVHGAARLGDTVTLTRDGRSAR